MALFVIADTHLSLSTDKPMDIFNGWDNYMERLEKNWRALVSDEDTVVIPADADEDTAFAAAMASEKVANLVAGKTIVKKIYVKNKIFNIIAK